LVLGSFLGLVMVGRNLLIGALTLGFATIPVGLGPKARVDHGEREAPRWVSYYDEATGTVVEYPPDVFAVEDAPPKPGLGRRFRTADGRASLTIYALPNRGGDTAWSYLRKHLAIGNKNLDYRRVTDRFFAISGIKAGQTFYSRCNFAAAPRNLMHCILLVYPARENRAWDQIVTRISLSLHAERAAVNPSTRTDRSPAQD
jgi:hypothetical protein